MMNRSTVFSQNPENPVILYHGSTQTIEKPLFNYGRADNDYGMGFYLTRLFTKAVAWAQNMGDSDAIVNKYELDISNLNVLNLDNYGPLAWIAEIASNRPIKSELADEFLPDFIKMYKVNTDDADVIIGYRADDSYTDVISAFCDGLLNCDEVQRLFYKGNLGEQYFIKSEKAFNTIKFISSEDVTFRNTDEETMLEVEARNSVYSFIAQRRAAIAKRFNVPPITIIDAITNTYKYNKEFAYYEMV